ncbi:MAG TPA: PfkB family carbohydrate kinase, partial [Thermomicrobiales bacterium]|nr:PfkB family carbohydrate kinase [Thermomicrobiales bacterium]
IEHVPAFAIDPVEPTGAGDAFTAAIISRYLVSHSAPNRADVAFAAAAGAITATRIGAIASLPYLSEIEEFLRRA